MLSSPPQTARDTGSLSRLPSELGHQARAKAAPAGVGARGVAAGQASRRGIHPAAGRNQQAILSLGSPARERMQAKIREDSIRREIAEGSQRLAQEAHAAAGGGGGSTKRRQLGAGGSTGSTKRRRVAVGSKMAAAADEEDEEEDEEQQQEQQEEDDDDGGGDADRQVAAFLESSDDDVCFLYQEPAEAAAPGSAGSIENSKVISLLDSSDDEEIPVAPAATGAAEGGAGAGRSGGGAGRGGVRGGAGAAAAAGQTVHEKWAKLCEDSAISIGRPSVAAGAKAKVAAAAAPVAVAVKQAAQAVCIGDTISESLGRKFIEWAVGAGNVTASTGAQYLRCVRQIVSDEDGSRFPGLPGTSTPLTDPRVGVAVAQSEANRNGFHKAGHSKWLQFSGVVVGRQQKQQRQPERSAAEVQGAAAACPCPRTEGCIRGNKHRGHCKLSARAKASAAPAAAPATQTADVVFCAGGHGPGAEVVRQCSPPPPRAQSFRPILSAA